MARISKRNRQKSRLLSCEQLEPRRVLSAAALVPVGQQPDGGLSGKIVYTHAGHGWTADNNGNGAWTTQRPETFELIEDLGNQDQMTPFADYAFRAGATVVPLRPVGHQPNEYVIDNDDVEVSYVGNWSNSSSSIYFGDVGDVAYRFAATSTTETAFARYQPNIDDQGFYPVYAWTRYGSDRAEDQLYRVHHSGGITEVTVNHRRVGNGLVYLGTYHFEAGNSGHVDISNRSNDPGRVIIADMIRFGNGMGDIDRGGGVSGFTREDEAGLYWVQWHVDRSQGIATSEYRTSSSDRTATVSLSPRYAEYMNREADGSLSDRVFISYHSNAGGGSARGILGLYNGNNSPGSATPNQFFLADTVAREVNNDLVAQNGQFEHNWAGRSALTLDRSDFEFGEINNTYIQNEFDATIIETGFHDNQLDAEMLRDPKVRDAVARATYQGVVKYFRAVDGSTPLTMAPAAVTGVRAESLAEGVATISWDFSQSGSAVGDAATGYRVFASTNGYGFDGGTEVAGGVNQLVLTDLDPNQTYFFKVAAYNEGGESPGSAIVALIPGDLTQRVLIVNGFDRFDRTLNPRVTYGNLTVDRVRPRFSNSFDYAVQSASAIAEYSSGISVDTVPNQFVATGTANLGNYDAVIWISGEESTADRTFDAAEQNRVETYLAGGGKLFVSGSEIGWDLDQQNNGRAFYNDTLRTQYVADDANTYQAQGLAGSLFEGLSLTFDDGDQFYDVNFPDIISPAGGSTPQLRYAGGSGGTAAIAYDPGTPEGRIVVFGFPFETIVDANDRAQAMASILQFFDFTSAANGDLNDDGNLDCNDIQLLSDAISSGSSDLSFDVNSDGILSSLDVLDWIVEIKGTGMGDATLDFTVDTSDFNIWNANKFTTGTTWCQGDFNADGVTDISDFNLWNANKFTIANLPSSSIFSSTLVAAEGIPFAMLPKHPTSFSRPRSIDHIFEQETSDYHGDYMVIRCSQRD